MRGVLDLCNLNNRSLLGVNEDCEGKQGDKITL